MTPHSRSLLLRVHELLDGKLDVQQTDAVASDYNQFCEQLQARIRQFSKLLKEGQYYAALDVAQLEPTLTTQIERIRFPRESEWRNFLTERGIACFPGFDDSELKRVKEVCADRSLRQPPAYRDYRKAILLKNRSEAIQHLRQLHTAYPKDLNAKQELIRLEKEAFESIEKELSQLLRLEKTDLAIERVRSTLQQDWIIPLEGDAWKRSVALHAELDKRKQLDQLNQTLSQAKVIQRVGNWRDAEPLIQKLRSTRESDLYQELTAVQQNELNGLLKWFHETELQHDVSRKNQEGFETLLSQLDPDALQQKYQHAPSKQVRLAQKQLAAEWKHFESLTPKACQEQRSSFERAQRVLDELARHRRRRHSRFRWVWILMLPLVGVAGVALFWLNQQEASLASAVRSSYEQRDVPSTRQALTRWDAFTERFYSSLNPFRHYRAHRQVAEVRSWIHELRLRHEKIQELLTRTESELQTQPGRAELRRIRLNLTIAEELLDKLPRESYAEAHDRFAALTQTHEEFQQQHVQQMRSELSGELTAITQDMRSTLTPDRADFSDLEKDLEELRTAIRSAESHIAQALDLSHITDLQDQLASLKQEVDAYGSAHATLVQLKGRLLQSIALSEYLDYLSQIAQLPLKGHPLVQHAQRLNAERERFENLAQQLLLPGNALAWQQFLKRMDEPLIAEGLDPKERTVWRQLAGQDPLREIYRYRLFRYQDGEAVGNFRWVFTHGEARIESSPDSSGSQVRTAVVQEFDERLIGVGRGIPFAEMQYTCKTDASGAPIEGDLLEFDRLSPESGYYREVAALCGFQGESEGFSRPLLEVMDRVKAEAFISPIFKAWVLQELFNLMLVRAFDWGLNFCPAAQLEYRNLSTIKGTLFPFDWLRPSTQNRILQPLTRYFDSLPKHSYHQQAIASRELFKQVSRQRVRFGGYVDDTGRFMLLSATPNDRTLFGLREQGVIDVLRTPRMEGTPATEFPAVPYSPIMFFNDPPRIILERVTRNIGFDVSSEAFRPFLPSIFLDSQ